VGGLEAVGAGRVGGAGGALNTGSEKLLRIFLTGCFCLKRKEA